MTPGQHFELIILAITLATGLLAWLLRYVLKSFTDATQDNTKAIRDLDKTIVKLTSRMVRVETILDPDKPPGNHRIRYL